MHNRAVVMSDNVIMNTSILKTIDETLLFQLLSFGIFQSATELRTKWIMPSTDVVAFIQQGSGKIAFRESGETCSIRRGEAILSPGGMVRRNRFLPENGKLVIIWAHLRYEITRGFNPLKLFQFPKVFKGSEAADMGGILGKITSVNRDTEKLSLSSISREKALGMELLALLTDGCEPKGDAPSLLNKYRGQSGIIGHIEDHLKEKITVADLARLSCLSVSRFHRVFKNATGRSPTDFIIERRVQTAKRLLATTSMSLSEIADATGFSSAYYFSRMFKRFGGSSPSAYRKSSSSDDAIF